MGDPTRRDVVRLVGLGAAARLVACGDNVRAGDAASAILEPASDRVTVSVWARHARSAIVELDGRTHELVLGESGSGAFEIAGLAPATAYDVAITTSDGAQLVHTARTAPRDDDARPTRIAVFADVDPNHDFDTDLADHVVAAAPDLLVSIGDFPYTDNGPVAETLEVYRDRHAEIRRLPKVRALLQAAPLYAIYDDHEFRNNWDAAFVAKEPSRYAAAMTVWDEFFPVRGAAGEVRYRSWRWGANVECFLLDCRRFRSADAAPDDANKTMLGATQREWLLAGLRASTAPFKVIFTSVPLGFGTGDDHWSTFTTERDALLAALVGIPGIVFIAGDQHFFAAHRHAHGVREFQIGPYARGLGTPGPEAPGVLFRAVQYNVGLLDVSADRLVVTGLAPGGEQLYQETLTPADLTPA